MQTAPLTEATWPALAALVEAHGGVFGGCWCIGFHAERNKIGGYDARRDAKLDKVRNATTHAALVLEGDACIGWAQYGSPAELPMIKSRKAYDAADAPAPDWRITCFFVDKAQRRSGIAAKALDGALALIAGDGGGVVEGYPEEIAGQKTAAAFLFGGTTSLFERAGFTRDRKIGLHRWVMRKRVTPS